MGAAGVGLMDPAGVPPVGAVAGVGTVGAVGGRVSHPDGGPVSCAVPGAADAAGSAPWPGGAVEGGAVEGGGEAGSSGGGGVKYRDARACGAAAPRAPESAQAEPASAVPVRSLPSVRWTPPTTSAVAMTAVRARR
ncbi:hypothetical protein AB0M31_32075 [Streptomyces sp. NPDC051773]|uniref:hypothetical protein n=1 Tax=Streptomyces sp. NPDC051773 TaxID=3156682 RepID=UPI003422D8EA